MVYIKKEKEIEALRKGGQILAAILHKLAAMLKPGLSTLILEEVALTEIEKAGGRPAFKDYPMGGGIYFPSALCVSINDEVVHGASLPERIIKEGDIVDLDIGMEWPVKDSLREKFCLATNPHSKHGGFFTDTCVTVPVGEVKAELKKLLRVTKESLYRAIEEAKPGNRLNDIARAVESLAKKHGYGLVRDLVGHGVGYFAHEEPDVPNFSIDERSSDNLLLKEGMVIAIEPMINLGTYKVNVADNDYTIVTADSLPSAHFEHTVYISKDGPEIITKYEKS